MKTALTPEALAQACADAMWASDMASRNMGMTLVAVAPGQTEIAMTVRPEMVNGHGICHGGYIFSLADSAFAFACNTYDQRCVAQHCTITYLSPGKLGERLIARAREKQRSGRSGIYDVTVSTADGRVVAEFRGHSRSIEGSLLGGDHPTGGGQP